jgi:hypothetical protein
MPDPRSEPKMVALSAESSGEGPGPEVENVYSLRPRTAPQLLDLGMEVLANRFLLCVGVCVVLWFPLRLLMSYFFSAISSADSIAIDLTFGWTFLTVTLLVQGLTEVVATVAVTLISYEELLGRRLTLREMSLRTLRRFPALIVIFVITLLTGASILLGVVCFPFLAVFFFLRWKLSIAPSALVLEDLSLGQALSRSFELTRGSFGRFFGLMILAWFLGAGFAGGMQIGDNIEIREQFLSTLELPPDVFEVFFVVISSLFAGIVTAINAVAITAYYLDTRIRREGLDLEMILERKRSAAASGGEPAW